MDKVSIIVPVYNVENDLAYCIDSILSQTYENIELLLIDDGSSDSSPEICDEYAKKDKRVRVYHRKNGGVSSARNYGLDNAEGEYVLFVDSDDRIAPDTVKDNINLAIANNLDMVIFSFYYHITAQDCINPNIIDKSFCGNHEDFFNECFNLLIDKELINAPWNKFIRREIIEKNGIRFNENFSICEDMAFSVETLSACERIMLNNKIYYDYYIKQSGSLVFKFHENYFEALSNFYRLAMEYCNKYKDNEEQKKKLDTLYASLTIMFIKMICCRHEDNAKTKISHIMSICSDKKFRVALNNADLNRKKRTIRRLIQLKQYKLIYVLYNAI